MARALRAAFYAAGIVGLGVATWRTAGSSTVLAPWHALASAAALLLASLAAAAAAWVVLLPGARSRRALVRGFVAAQLGKYIPGGIWLAAGQIGLAGDAGISTSRAAGAFAACAVALTAAAGVVAGVLGILVLAGSGPAVTGLLPLAALGLALPALLDRRWMAWIARRIAGRRGVPAEVMALPGQRAIVGACAWLTVTMLTMALAYALLLQSVGGDAGILRVMCVFTIAWLAGFLALGVPSGIGVREAVLVALLPGAAGPVLAASLAQRVVQMATEAAFVLATREWRVTARAAGSWLRARLALVPNAISAFRVALVPILWLMAFRGEAGWVVVGLVVAGASDLLDGYLARRLQATSSLGAQLDSLGDNLLALSGVAWLVMLRPDVVEAFLLPLQALLALYLVFLGVGWAKFRRFGNLHLYSGKLSAIFLYAFLLHSLWFAAWSVPLFYAMWSVTAVALLEGLTYQLISRSVDEDAGSLVRVLLQRRETVPGADAARRAVQHGQGRAA
jgi:phosphatidylglycerophosphate synthase